MRKHLRPVDDKSQNYVRSKLMTLRFRRTHRGRSFDSNSYVTYRRRGQNHLGTVVKYKYILNYEIE